MKIVIQTQADFTPAGKRGARIVQTDRGGRQLRWYVSGRIFRHLPVNADNIKLTQEWIVAATRARVTKGAAIAKATR